MPDRTILVLITTLILILFRYIRSNSDEPYNKKYDDYLPQVYRRTPIKQSMQFNDAALEKTSQLITKYPMDAGAYGDRGAIYIKLKQYDKGLADLNKAIELQPAYADALNNRGVAYYYMGLFTQAVNDFTSALSHVSEDYAYYSNRGMAYKKIGDRLKAGTDFNRANELYGQANENTCIETRKQTFIAANGATTHEQPHVVFFKLDILFVKYQRAAYGLMNV